MCSQFQLHGMENYQGDLTDIIRGSAGAGSADPQPAVPDTWQYPDGNESNMAAAAVMNCYPSSDHQDFGDPFCTMRDPMMFQELSIPPPPPSAAAFFTCRENDLDLDLVDTTTTTTTTTAAAPKLVLDEEMKRPACNIFSRMLQISPNSNLNNPPPPPLAAAGGSGGRLSCGENIISASSSSSSSAGMQISSPRNTGSIKRRKSQAKKVMCVPAPAPANSRPSGEVVPSDLWAWRKYGQKPIKGSPYPRGYYRCSSSKGCSARKQVERSRTDPNMLVITYTSEHNHPWPTQRNALAGSTRALAAKFANSQTPNPPTSKDNQPDPTPPPLKEETTTTTTATPEDHGGDDDHHHHHHHHHSIMQMNELAGAFPHGYKPAMPTAAPDDFFADLGEIETTDPLNLMFSQGAFSSEQEKNKSAMAAIDDAFNFYDWTTNNNNSITKLGKSDRHHE